MFWWILGGINIVLAIAIFVIIIIGNHSAFADWIKDLLPVLFILCLSISICILIVCPVVNARYKEENSLFKQQKYYIEEVMANAS